MKRYMKIDIYFIGCKESVVCFGYIYVVIVIFKLKESRLFYVNM